MFRCHHPVRRRDRRCFLRRWRLDRRVRGIASLRRPIRHGGGILGDGSWSGHRRRVWRGGLRGRTVRLRVRYGPDSMKCNDETHAQRQRPDRDCKHGDSNFRHLKSRRCRLGRCKIRRGKSPPRACRRKGTVQIIIGRNFRTIDSSAFLFRFFPFHGRRHIGLHGRRSCDRNYPRRDILFGRLLKQLLFHCRRSVSFRGQRSANLDRRRHKVLNYADLQRWLVFIRNHRRVLAKKTVDQRSLARVQQGKRELSKVAKGPEQINALPKGGFNGN